MIRAACGINGLFITLEGGEGAGKSTQSKALAAALSGQGREVVSTREPGSTPLGDRLREILLGIDSELDPLAEAMLFAAARAELVSTVIKPALDLGDFVICDRYSDSTVAYQGYARGVDLMSIGQLNQIATGGLVSDLAVLLDLPVAEGLRRSGDSDRFKSEDAAFHERVRAGYLALAEHDAERWLVVDATQPPETVTATILERVETLL
ncbi:MAG: dTMP kinase [Chloroflexi bacterium]|nr:dTMP kinase [Chloroflexota bacterium]MCH8008178.1 dTMP kinase [Chloroflexota bacterium]